MTAAQDTYLRSRGIDPWSLRWNTAVALGHPDFGRSEAAVLPDGRILLANGNPTEAPA